MDTVKKYPLVGAVLFFLLAGFIHVATSRGLFFDEGIYFVAGKSLVFFEENWNFETWFVGSPWVYPSLIGQVLKTLTNNGLTGFDWTNQSIPIVRGVNVGLSLITLLVVHRIAKLLFGRSAAGWSAVVFATAGCVIFTSGFATYDSLSLLLTALSIWMAVEGTKEEFPGPLRIVLLVVSGGLLAASFVTKYITIVFFPTLLALIFLRLATWEDKKGFLTKLFFATLAFSVSAIVFALFHIIPHWDAMTLVFGFSGGHTTTYGATPDAILYEIVYFVGIVWALALLGMSRIRSGWIVGLMLLGASFTTPFYHLWFRDPLALFKQMMWAVMLASIVAGAGLHAIVAYTKKGWIVPVVIAIFGIYQVWSLQQFYPDPTPAAEWLQENVTKDECNILVDNVWAYRWALNTTFDQKEWCVLDQWWWYNNLATPEFWIGEIEKGTFPYIVKEEGGGAFNGNYTIFNDDVTRAVETSENYMLVAMFESHQTWGNAVLPQISRGILPPNSDITTEIWRRKW